MSLRDEFPINDQAVVFSRIRYSDHDEIAQQTREFMARGGRITPIPTGVCTISEARPPLRNEYTGEVSIKEYDSRSSRQKKASLSAQHQSAFGENIYQYANSKYFYVKLDGRYYGAKMRLTNDAARELRDKLRAEFGMPEASY